MSDEELKSKERRQQENIETFLDRGPGLSYKYNTWIIAKNPKEGRVKLGGLGGMGVGQMWVDDKPYLNHPDYAASPVNEK